LKVTQVLSSPNTGVINSHEFMSTLLHHYVENNGIVSFGQKFEDAEKSPTGDYNVTVFDMNENCLFQFKSDSIINSAGLFADKVSKKILKEKWPIEYELQYCKGHYFKCNKNLLNLPNPKLIYPSPEKNLQGLGIHLTVDVGGNAKFGPDFLYVQELDYSFQNVDILRENFFQAIRRYLPSMEKKVSSRRLHRDSAKT